MKVLKLGKEIKQECPSCKSLLEIEEQDWESPKGSGFNKMFTRCPICGELIYQDWVLSLYNQDDVHIRSNKEVKSVGIDSAWDDCKEGIMEVDFNNPDPHFATQEGKPI